MQLKVLVSRLTRRHLSKNLDNLEPAGLPPYIYSPLKADEIRLIVICKGQEADHVLVQLEVVKANTTRAPAYAALSYVWGDATKKEYPVVVNGNTVHWVTYNLWQALRRIRASYEDRVIWADALCINQDDLEERSRQVQQMRWIYPQAKTVLCWLGDDDGSVAEAFSELNKWADAYENDEQRSLCAHKARACLAHREPDKPNSLGLLFNRPYFSRAWCLPEVCVHPKKALVLCGEHEISWRRLYFGFLTMATSVLEHELGQIVGESVTRVIPMLKICWNPPEKMLLSYLMPLIADRECSDPRDKIFSLLGLVARRGVSYPPVDYSRTNEEVCIMYTRAAIQVERGLDILRGICPFRDNDTMPSWSLKPDQWLKDFSGELELLSGMPFDTYNACANMEMRIEDGRNWTDRELRVHGFQFDSIVGVHDTSELLEDLFSLPTRWQDVLEKSENFCKRLMLSGDYGPTAQPIAEAFLDTLCGNEFWMRSEEMKAPFRRELIYNAYEEHVRGTSVAGHTTLGAPREMLDKTQLFHYMACKFTFARLAADRTYVAEKLDPVVPHSFLERQAILELRHVVNEKVQNRRLFITSNGYIGFGLKTCSVSDKVCLLPGSAVPLILRTASVSDPDIVRHVFVGDAYVHGIMYGEAVKHFAVSTSGTSGREQCAEMELFHIV